MTFRLSRCIIVLGSTIDCHKIGMSSAVVRGCVPILFFLFARKDFDQFAIADNHDISIKANAIQFFSDYISLRGDGFDDLYNALVS